MFIRKGVNRFIAPDAKSFLRKSGVMRREIRGDCLPDERSPRHMLLCSQPIQCFNLLAGNIDDGARYVRILYLYAD